MSDILFFIIGFVFGGSCLGVAWFVVSKKNGQGIDRLKAEFNELSQNVLDSQAERFLSIAQGKLEAQTKVGEKDLDSKKQLIDATLSKVEKRLADMEKERSQAYGSLSSQLKNASSQTENLQKITSDLKSVLSNNKVRGQWGERMAEDILRMAGFIEGIQYDKQKQQLDSKNGKGKPDFTFKMPDGHILNMDVKFPLSNYENYLSADAESDKEKYKKEFLKDAKLRVTEVTERGYINKETLDYVLLFIPNEQIYSFINEHDRKILDDALQRKVIICGPNTLYAILAVVRQASENFQLEKKSSEILNLLANFKKQWGLYSREFEKLDSQFGTFSTTFERLKGDRTRIFEKHLDKIESVSQAEEIKKIEE